MRIQRRTMILIALVAISAAAFAQAGTPDTFGLDTSFVYRGRLTQMGGPADGRYDLELELWDRKEGGTLLGRTALLGHPVADGRFEADLDFGQNLHGGRFWLEIRVRSAGAEAYTTLEPRQLLESPEVACVVGSDLVVEGYLGIATSSPLSAFHLDGNLTLHTRVAATTGSGTIAMAAGDLVLFASADIDDFYVQLPDASAGTVGRVYWIYNTSNHQMMVQPYPGDTIIGGTVVGPNNAGAYVQVIGYSATQWVATVHLD